MQRHFRGYQTRRQLDKSRLLQNGQFTAEEVDAIHRYVHPTWTPIDAPAITRQNLSDWETSMVRHEAAVRLKIIRNARIENVGKYQSCMVSKLTIICKQVNEEESRLRNASGP